MRRAFLLLALAVPGTAAAQAGGSWSATREWINVCGGTTIFTCGSIRLEFTAQSIAVSMFNLSGLYGSNPYSTFAALTFSGLPVLRDQSGAQVNYLQVAFYNDYLSPTGPLFPAGAGSHGSSLWAQQHGRLGESDRFTVYSEWYWFHPVTGDGYYGDALASSCALPLYADYWLYASPACGSAGLIGGDVNGGWYEYTVMLESGYTMDPIDLAALSVTIGVDNPILNPTLQYYDALICGGPNSNCVVTPEPMSIVLIATGLLAFGFAELRRRRRARAA